MELADNRAIEVADNRVSEEHQILYEAGTHEKEVIEIKEEDVGIKIDQSQNPYKEKYEEEAIIISTMWTTEHKKKAAGSTWKMKARSTEGIKTETYQSSKRKIEAVSSEGKEEKPEGG